MKAKRYSVLFNASWMNEWIYRIQQPVKYELTRKILVQILFFGWKRRTFYIKYESSQDNNTIYINKLQFAHVLNTKIYKSWTCKCEKNRNETSKVFYQDEMLTEKRGNTEKQATNFYLNGTKITKLHAIKCW